MPKATAKEVIELFKELTWTEQKKVLDDVIPMDEYGLAHVMKRIWPMIGAEDIAKWIGDEGVETFFNELAYSPLEVREYLAKLLFDSLPITFCFDKKTGDRHPREVRLQDIQFEFRPPSCWLTQAEAAAIIGVDVSGLSNDTKKRRLKTNGVKGAGIRYCLHSVQEYAKKQKRYRSCKLNK